MNIREAILKAADYIEVHPAEFNFMSISIPKGGCGTPGCALGWIGHFANIRSGIDKAAKKALGLADQVDFYRRMDIMLCGSYPGPTTWRQDPKECARALRLYADRFHPAEKAEVGEWGLCPWTPELYRVLQQEQESADADVTGD